MPQPIPIPMQRMRWIGKDYRCTQTMNGGVKSRGTGNVEVGIEDNHDHKAGVNLSEDIGCAGKEFIEAVPVFTGAEDDERKQELSSKAWLLPLPKYA